MDEKYIVQFVTLLGGAVVSIIMAYRVFTHQVEINYALVVLLFAIILFFIIGRIVRRVLYGIKKENIERQRQEQELERKRREEEEEENLQTENADEMEEEETVSEEGIIDEK
ncbi:MAG: hypothetical protein HFH14_08930 [Lachnospiraceae bacterium]|nr:hypothetical protein [Lachnospiraceae bacterium]